MLVRTHVSVYVRTERDAAPTGRNMAGSCGQRGRRWLLPRDTKREQPQTGEGKESHRKPTVKRRRKYQIINSCFLALLLLLLAAIARTYDVTLDLDSTR